MLNCTNECLWTVTKSIAKYQWKHKPHNIRKTREFSRFSNPKDATKQRKLKISFLINIIAIIETVNANV